MCRYVLNSIFMIFNHLITQPDSSYLHNQSKCKQLAAQ